MARGMPAWEEMPLRGKLPQRQALLWAALLVVAGSLLAPAGRAQTSDPRAEQQRLFEITRRQPGDHAATARYVEASMRLGDTEAAIGALERLAFFDPTSARVKYELGLLYERIGSHATAVQYFQAALLSPSVDAVTRDKVEAYLPDAEKALQQSRFSGRLQAGLRYQSNANLLPGGDTIRAFGFDVAPLARPRRDWNAFALAQIGHDYDFGNQRGDRFETRVSLYATRQFRLTDLDVALGEISLGPRLALAPDLLPGATVKPYVVGGGALLGGRDYLTSAGAGLAFAFPFGAAVSVEPGVEWRRAHVRDSAPLPGVATLATGDVLSLSTAVIVKPADHISFETRGSYRRADASLSFQRFDQWRGDAMLRVSFDPPFASIARQWSVGPFVGIALTRFDDPNPSIDPAITRRDREYRAGLVLEAPVTASIGLNSVFEYQTNRSNLPNYRMSGWSIMFGPTARF